MSKEPKATGLRTIIQTAADLNMSPHTIRQWIATRKLGHIRLGRAIRVPVAEIDRLLEEGFIPARRQGAR